MNFTLNRFFDHKFQTMKVTKATAVLYFNLIFLTFLKNPQLYSIQFQFFVSIAIIHVDLKNFQLHRNMYIKIHLQLVVFHFSISPFHKNEI